LRRFRGRLYLARYPEPHWSGSTGKVGGSSIEFHLGETW